MIINKSQQIVTKFHCEKCEYNCSNKFDYNKHLSTAKHKKTMNDNKKSQQIATAYKCECGKSYKYASGLSRHKMLCSFENENCVTDKSITNLSKNKERLFLELMSKNNDLMDMLQEQNRTIKEQNKIILELVPKIGNNNNNTTNNNNQFNLQVFLNEDCKDAINFSDFIKQIQVSFDDLENQAENGYIKGISKLFLESLHDLGQDKRPIHCSDKKRKTLYIKENNEWDKEGSHEVLRKGINEVTRRTFEALIKSKEENAEEYEDNESDFSNKCVSIQKNLNP